jgi:hypothetical protein
VHLDLYTPWALTRTSAAGDRDHRIRHIRVPGTRMVRQQPGGTLSPVTCRRQPLTMRM